MRSFFLSTRDKLLKFIKHDLFPFFVLFILLIIFHSLIHRSFGDDLHFAKILDENNLIDWLVYRYNNWSSRLVNEVFLVTISRYPILWGFLDSLIISFGGYVIYRLFSKERNRNNSIVISLLLLCLPIYLYCSAGFIATTIGYFWIGFIGIASFIGIKKLFNNEKIRWFEYIFYILAILFSSCHEQMCAIMLVTFLVFFVIYIYKYHKVNWYLLTGLILNLLSVVFILTCPGNSIRLESEIKEWFPAFANLNFFSKINIGFDFTMYEYVFRPNLIFAILLGLLFTTLLIKKEHLSLRILSLIPILVSLVFAIGINVIGKYLDGFASSRELLLSYGVGLEYDSPYCFVPTLIYLAILIIVSASIYFAFDTLSERLLMIFVLLLGFGARMMMSFSPTNWASSTRPFFFMYISLIIICFNLFQNIKSKKISLSVVICLGTASLVSYSWMIAYGSCLIN